MSRTANELLIAQGGLRIPASAAAGKIAVSDGAGNVQWQTLAAAGVPAIGRSSTNALAGNNADGLLLPRYYGYKSWNFQPLLLDSTLTVSGVAASLVVFKMPWLRTDTITNALFFLATAGATPTNAYAAIFDATGAQKCVTADISATLTQAAPSISTMPMTAPTSVPGGEDTYIYVGLMVRGAWATFPVLGRYSQSTSQYGNVGLTAANYLQGSTGSGLTTMPASFTPSALGNPALSGLFWAGVS